MKDITLFDYQKEMLVRVRSAFRHHRSVMVQMPTGTGKTCILAAVVAEETATSETACTWVVTHRRELVAQTIDMLRRFGIAHSSDAKSHVRVVSIQWLSRHHRELQECPTLIVIDEAHHAVATTYAELMSAYPDARKLGLTATPCRLNGKGFGDLFDVLLTSLPTSQFIAKGRLSPYDYYSIRPDSADQRLVDSLVQRGIDGDYQPSELDSVLNVRPSVERLCATVLQYVSGKKGIVYAVNISHAEHIADTYRSRGISAVAISSATPTAERKLFISRFREGNVQVLVSVDLFAEGFDCPDVEFIQLARPTLSLVKYVQMVGRGLRVAEGKDYCVILDNVGLYRRFGLPSAHHDWHSLFEGRVALCRTIEEMSLRINSRASALDGLYSYDGEMMKILGHEHVVQSGFESDNYVIVHDSLGHKGIARADGDIVVACHYADVELTADGYACCQSLVRGRRQKSWVDLRSGLWFAQRPASVRLLGVDFTTPDGKRLYPRIRSQFVDDKTWLTEKTLELQVGAGIYWRRRFVPFDEPGTMYLLKAKINGARLFVDDVGSKFVQVNVGSRLVAIESMADVESCIERVAKEENTSSPERNDEPRLFKRGFVEIGKYGNWCFVLNIPQLSDIALRDWQIVADNNCCVIHGDLLILRQEPNMKFRIIRRNDDFSYFEVREWNDGIQSSSNCVDINIIVTQDANHGIRMECNGYPYMPHIQVAAIRKSLR